MSTGKGLVSVLSRVRPAFVHADRSPAALFLLPLMHCKGFLTCLVLVTPWLICSSHSGQEVKNSNWAMSLSWWRLFPSAALPLH